ncbi:dynobactin A family peptide antibiotic [Pandoraea sputorum]
MHSRASDSETPVWNQALLDSFGGDARASFEPGQAMPDRYRNPADRETACSYHWNGNVHTYHYFKDAR